MWAHKPWIGRFYPAATRAERTLEAYAGLLNAVEGNTTFYALPSAHLVARWAEQVPADLRIAFKLPRRITHERRLRGAEADVAEFLTRLAPLADRMGPTSVQLPASFAPADLGTLAAFLAALPAEHRWAVEVRHRGFFAGGAAEAPLDELLASRRVDRVILDSRALYGGPRETDEEREQIRTKPELPVRPVATARHRVVRFIGQNEPEANPVFWRPWIATCARWLADGREPYVFVHTPANAFSPALARRFHAEVAAVTAGLAPLPGPPEAVAGLF